MIVFLSKEDPMSLNAWSGIHHFLYQSLKKHVAPTTPLGPAYPLRTPLHRFRSKAIRALTGRNHKYAYDPSLVRSYAELFDHRLKEMYDTPKFIFSSLTIPEIGQMQTDLPIIATADATFRLLKDYYYGHSNLTKRTVRNALEMEEEGLKRADYLIYPSQWVAESAIEDYDIPREKVIVQPYGANLQHPPTSDEVEAFLTERRKRDELRLLFIGKDWNRKGGKKAYEVKEYLKDQGIDARLIVVGCSPPSKYRDADVDFYPYLDKGNPKDAEQLKRLFGTSHFFLLPTRNECFGIVFNEASAHGLPSLTTRTGGIPTIVEDEVNGCLFPTEASAKEYGERAQVFWQDYDRYESLCSTTRKRYKNSLNWDVWGERMKELIDQDDRFSVK